jgi:hypothetical protein
MIRNNEITDVSFMVENGGNSSGQAGIQLDNSTNITIEANTIRRVSFGISINNKPACAMERSVWRTQRLITCNTLVLVQFYF